MMVDAANVVTIISVSLVISIPIIDVFLLLLLLRVIVLIITVVLLLSFYQVFLILVRLVLSS